MSYPVPKELRGEERLFVIKWLNLPFKRKAIIYNGVATLIAIIIREITGSFIVFLGVALVLNVIAYPIGHSKIANNRFDNGGMDYDKYLKGRIKWHLNNGGNVYISHKIGGE